MTRGALLVAVAASASAEMPDVKEREAGVQHDPIIGSEEQEAVDADLHAGLTLLKPGKLVIAAYPNFYPVCHYVQDGDGAAKDSGARTNQGIPSTEEEAAAAAKPTGGRFAGLEVDLLRRFCHQWGLELDIFAVPNFDGIWTYPARGLADTAIGGITSSPTRNSPALAWSAPYFTVTRTLVYHRANPPTDLAFPEGVAGVIRGTPGSTGYLDADARMTAHGNRHLLWDSTDDEEDIQALLRHEIQGMVRGSSVGRAIVQRYPEQLAMLEPWEILPHLSPTPMGEVFCLPARSESTLAAHLTNFLARERENGGLKELLAKHRLLM